MLLHWIDLTVLGGYLILVVGMGAYFSKKNINTEEYFLGGRSFSGLVIGLSLVGTSISSITFLSYGRCQLQFLLPLTCFFLFSAVSMLPLLMSTLKIVSAPLFEYMAV